jgi:hypothetical protein
MPNPNALVSSTIRLEPPLERAPAEMLRAEPGLSVVLDDGRRARLDPDNPRSAGWAQLLDGLSRQRLPVYLEVDPETSAITRLEIPLITRVVDLHVTGEGIEVEVEFSHARHLLPRDAPDFQELQRPLGASREDGRIIVLTEDDAHRIIDVRAFTPGPETPLPPFPPFPRPRTPKWPWPIRWMIELWRWIWWPWRWFGKRCMSGSAAQHVFDDMAATSCNPTTVPPPCIPFLYPDDGCWGRAHQMCRLMINSGVSPKKVWIEISWPDRLHADTRNHPSCFVEWGWHVAPTICVRSWKWGFFPWSHEMVVDPSLFDTPVSKSTWRNAQNPAATLTDSHWTIFYLWGNLTDPTFTQTDQVLATHRLKLQQRSLGPSGPPPYAHCP